jgi:hypothetical protein
MALILDIYSILITISIKSIPKADIVHAEQLYEKRQGESR